MQRFDQAALRRRQQLEIIAAGGCELERGIHLDADHVPTRREAQLAPAGEQHVSGLVLLQAHQGVLAVSAELLVGSWLAAGAGPGLPGTAVAVAGPAAEVPLGAGSRY
jgi:hypothetical protein